MTTGRLQIAGDLLPVTDSSVLVTRYGLGGLISEGH